MQCRNGKVTQGWESHGLALEPWDMESLQHGDWECGRNSSAIYLSLETSLWRTDQKSFLKQRRDQWMRWFWRLFFCRCPSSHFLVNICTWTTHWVSNARCLKENCLPLPIGSSSGLHFCPCYSNPGQVLSQSLSHALLFLPNSSSPDNILMILFQWSFVCVLLRGFVLGSGITMPSTLVCCSQDGFACCWCTEEGRPVAKVVWKCFTEGSRRSPLRSLHWVKETRTLSQRSMSSSSFLPAHPLQSHEAKLLKSLLSQNAWLAFKALCHQHHICVPSFLTHSIFLWLFSSFSVMLWNPNGNAFTLLLLTLHSSSFEEWNLSPMCASSSPYLYQMF